MFSSSARRVLETVFSFTRESNDDRNNRFEKISTKRLLSLFRRSRLIGEYDVCKVHFDRAALDLDWMHEWDKDYFYANEPVVDLVGITMLDLKKELSTREHVPSKKEGSILRREKAKKGRSSGRKDR